MKKNPVLLVFLLITGMVHSQSNTVLPANVGIGILTPTASLHVAAENSNHDGTIKIGERAWVQHRDEGNTTTSFINDYNSDYSKIDFRMKGTAGSNAVMTLQGNGFVGIGTNYPQVKLELVNGGEIIRHTNPVYYSTFRLYNDQNTPYRSLEIDYSGSAYSGSLLVNGPQGESASIGTVGSYPLAFGTGNIARMTITGSGNIGMGTIDPGDYRLAVNGKIRAKKVVVETSWSDYVFDKAYKLQSLSSLESFIRQNKHLPGVPTAKEVEKNGISVGESQALLLKKIEEMTLHLIRLNKMNIKLSEENRGIKKRLASLEGKTNKLPAGR
jgi:hypothetical protein